MRYWETLLALVCATVLAGAEAPKQGDAITLTTLDGRSFTNATITRIDPIGISLMTDSGIRRLAFTNLQEASRAQFGYDPRRATEAIREAEDRRTSALEANQQRHELAKRWAPWESSIAARREEIRQAKITSSNVVRVNPAVVEAEEEFAQEEARLVSAKEFIRAAEQAGIPADQTQPIIRAMHARTLYVGMPAQAVRIAWGVPDEVNRTFGAGGKSEQWVYPRGNFKSSYVHVEDGLVTYISE